MQHSPANEFITLSLWWARGVELGIHIVCICARSDLMRSFVRCAVSTHGTQRENVIILSAPCNWNRALRIDSLIFKSRGSASGTIFFVFGPYSVCISLLMARSMVMAAGWQVDWSPRRVRPPQTASDWSSSSARCFWCGATPPRRALLDHLLLFPSCTYYVYYLSHAAAAAAAGILRVKQKRLMTRGAEL